MGCQKPGSQWVDPCFNLHDFHWFSTGFFGTAQVIRAEYYTLQSFNSSTLKSYFRPQKESSLPFPPLFRGMKFAVISLGLHRSPQISIGFPSFTLTQILPQKGELLNFMVGS